MTLGQEFMAYAVMIGEDERRLVEACLLIQEVNLGYGDRHAAPTPRRATASWRVCIWAR
jgi:aspartate ammonia-lyase